MENDVQLAILLRRVVGAGDGAQVHTYLGVLPQVGSLTSYIIHDKSILHI